MPLMDEYPVALQLDEEPIDIEENTHWKLNMDMLMNPWTELRACQRYRSTKARSTRTFSHSRVEPGTTDRSGCSSTSSFLAVVFNDCRSRSYSPMLGSSPIPTTMTQSACGLDKRRPWLEPRNTHLTNTRLCPWAAHSRVRDVEDDPILLLLFRQPARCLQFPHACESMSAEVVRNRRLVKERGRSADAFECCMQLARECIHGDAARDG